MKIWILLQSYALLVKIDAMMRKNSLEAIHSLVREQVIFPMEERPHTKTISDAVELACVFYVKPVFCLEISAVTTILLRRYGWNAEMVIGAQMLPFRTHAWCEINGDVVNDKPYMRDIYAVLERC